MDDSSASDVDVLHFLKTLTKPKSVEDIARILEMHVGIDPSASTGDKKLLSLVVSFKKAVDKLGLSEQSTSDSELILPFKKKKEILLSKLPSQFQEEYDEFASYHKDPTDVKSLYQQLKQVEKKYSGSWNTAYAIPAYEESPMYKKHQEEHLQSVRETRSSKKSK